MGVVDEPAAALSLTHIYTHILSTRTHRRTHQPSSAPLSSSRVLFPLPLSLKTVLDLPRAQIYVAPRTMECCSPSDFDRDRERRRVIQLTLSAKNFHAKVRRGVQCGVQCAVWCVLWCAVLFIVRRGVLRCAVCGPFYRAMWWCFEVDGEWWSLTLSFFLPHASLPTIHNPHQPHNYTTTQHNTTTHECCDRNRWSYMSIQRWDTSSSWCKK